MRGPRFRRTSAALAALLAIALPLFAGYAGTAGAAASPIPNAATCNDYTYEPAGQYLNGAANDLIASLRRTGAEITHDARGVPRIKYGDRFFYNPVAIQQVGLEAISRYARTVNPEDLTIAVRMADWLLRSQQKKTGKWLYRFPVKIGRNSMRLPVPWASGMAQGQGISLLTRVYGVTQNHTYLAAAKRALLPLQRPVSRGGLLAKLFGHPFYEEAPTRPPSFIVNGFMFTLLGLHDLRVAAPESSANSLYRQGIKTLEFALPLFDGGEGVSLYSLVHMTDPPQPALRATNNYQKVHVMELCAINSITPRPIFAFYRDYWRSAIKG
jgi:heparosan-N-sulfate-glucuronate 5-epimerase